MMAITTSRAKTIGRTITTGSMLLFGLEEEGMKEASIPGDAEGNSIPLNSDGDLDKDLDGDLDGDTANGLAAIA